MNNIRASLGVHSRSGITVRQIAGQLRDLTKKIRSWLGSHQDIKELLRIASHVDKHDTCKECWETHPTVETSLSTQTDCWETTPTVRTSPSTQTDCWETTPTVKTSPSTQTDCWETTPTVRKSPSTQTDCWETTPTEGESPHTQTTPTNCGPRQPEISKQMPSYLTNEWETESPSEKDLVGKYSVN